MAVAKPSDWDETCSKWFPGLKASKTDEPQGRIICFSPAGSDEMMWTGKGNPSRPMPNPLLDWAVENKMEVYAVQLPGRMNRKKEPYLESCQIIANELADVMEWLLSDSLPYFVVGHSLGTWVGYEFIQTIKDFAGPPSAAFFSAFPHPSLPEEERPWKRNAELSMRAFKNESLAWDVNPKVTNELWKDFEPLFRADFSLFDQYSFPGYTNKTIDAPIHAFYATKDKKVTKEMVEGWKAYTGDLGNFTLTSITGHHLFPVDQPAHADARTKWLTQIKNTMNKIITTPWQPPNHGPDEAPPPLEKVKQIWSETKKKQALKSCLTPEAKARLERIKKFNESRVPIVNEIIADSLQLDGWRTITEETMVSLMNDAREKEREARKKK